VKVVHRQLIPNIVRLKNHFLNGVFRIKFSMSIKLKLKFQSIRIFLFIRSEESRSFFTRLKHELIRVNALVSEANTIASEMQRQTTYSAMLQIPVSYLKPSERVCRKVNNKRLRLFVFF